VNEQSEQPDSKKPHEIPIHIDGKQFKVDQEVMTGADLRQLAQIGSDATSSWRCQAARTGWLGTTRRSSSSLHPLLLGAAEHQPGG